MAFDNRFNGAYKYNNRFGIFPISHLRSTKAFTEVVIGLSKDSQSKLYIDSFSFFHFIAFCPFRIQFNGRLRKSSNQKSNSKLFNRYITAIFTPKKKDIFIVIFLRLSASEMLVEWTLLNRGWIWYWGEGTRVNNNKYRMKLIAPNLYGYYRIEIMTETHLCTWKWDDSPNELEKKWHAYSYGIAQPTKKPNPLLMTYAYKIQKDSIQCISFI